MAGKPINVVKQVTYALAQTLTGDVKEAQGAAISNIDRTFTVRNNWNQPSNAMGVKALPATKSDLSAALVTRADWLIGHEDGEDKVPEGNALAVPGRNVRRTKRDIIQRSQRPKALRGKRDVVLALKGGGMGLFQRKGRKANSKLVFMYTLAKRARLRRQPTVVEPTVKVFERKFDKLFFDNLRKALRSAK